ncbi:alkanesulfonate monooxygenase [Rhodococcus sp. 27YEA15]|uniref:LLM class flavin-dependent oxidoreductase n=1 Tax=Rhodococcus sp. 27YEA15 TaxID=3156259 RepID=UPI003C7D22E7
MALELRSWINPQPYTTGYSTSPIAREAAYFTTAPEPVTVDPDHVSREAREYEDAGYDSSIIPQSATWPDVAATAAWALAHTDRLRVVLAHRPGVQAPTAAARSLATLDRLSGGRAAIHLILGHADLHRDGDFVDHDDRYARGAEYLDIYTRTLTYTEPFDYDGQYYRVRGAFSGVRPSTAPRPPISLPGGSERGIDLAARYGDVIAFHGRSLAETSESIRVARQRADHYQRSVGFWVNLNFQAGETDGAAWDHVHELEQAIEHLKTYRAEGGSSVIPSIREERARQHAEADNTVVDSALYLGLSRVGGATPTLVGSPSTIADAVLAYHDLGVGIVTLGGYAATPAAAELRSETLRLIRQAAAAREASDLAGVTSAAAV